MGADISIPLSKIPDQTTIDNKTQSTIMLMNRILDFILRDADITDMVSLSTDKGCKEWLIIGESRLTELFDRIKIQPDAGKDGILYLKKLDQLVKESETKIPIGNKQVGHKDYCNVLAFFFIRLFQVVGALALSIIDTEIPRENYDVNQLTTQQQPRKGVPFFKTLEQKPKSWFSRGGGELVLDNFIKNNSLIVPYDQKIGGVIYKAGHIFNDYTINEDKGTYTIHYKNIAIDFTFTIDNKLIIDHVMNENNTTEKPLSIKKTYKIEGSSIKVGEKPIIEFIFSLFYEVRSRINYENSIFVLSMNDYINEDKIRDTNIVWNGSIDSPEFSISKVVDGTKIKIKFKIYITMVKNIYQLQIKDISISPDYISIEMSEQKDEGTTETADEEIDRKSGIVRFKLDKDGIPKNRWNTKIPDYLKRRFETLINKAEKALKEGLTKSKEGYLRPYTNTSSTNPLKYSELWDTIMKKPPIKSFCTARALQLLNASGLAHNVPSTIQTLVYDTKFPLLKNKSLPIQGDSILSAAPFKSLSQLYNPYDNIINTIKPSTSGLSSPINSKEKRQQSIGQLIYAFTQDLSSKITDIKDIKEPIPKGISQKDINDIAIIKALRAQAVKLFQKQFSHTKKVEAILKKLFIINNTITLNPAILAKGIKGIEEVAVEARELLTEYYSTCQLDYNDGLKLLQQQQKLNPSVPKI